MRALPRSGPNSWWFTHPSLRRILGISHHRGGGRNSRGKARCYRRCCPSQPDLLLIPSPAPMISATVPCALLLAAQHSSGHGNGNGKIEGKGIGKGECKGKGTGKHKAVELPDRCGKGLVIFQYQSTTTHILFCLRNTYSASNTHISPGYDKQSFSQRGHRQPVITLGRAQATSHQNSPGTSKQRAQATSHQNSPGTGRQSSEQARQRQTCSQPC